MCVQDIRIANRTDRVVATGSLDTPAGANLAGNGKRTSLIVSIQSPQVYQDPTSAFDIAVNIFSDGVLIGVVNAYQPTFIATYNTHGVMLFGKITYTTVDTGALGLSFTAIDVFLTEALERIEAAKGDR